MRLGRLLHREPRSHGEALWELPSGEAVQVFTLGNEVGIEARITNYGGIIVSLLVPDASGAREDVCSASMPLKAIV